METQNTNKLENDSRKEWVAPEMKPMEVMSGASTSIVENGIYYTTS